MKGKNLFNLLTIFLLLSCGDKRDKITGMGEVNRPPVKFNEELKLLADGKLYTSESIVKNHMGKKKIISIVDGVCMKCVLYELNEADKIFQKITKTNKLGQVIYILNVTPLDSAFFLRHLEPSIKVQGLLLWDNSYCFERTNDLLTANRNQRTFLLDERNNIILFGNPLYNPKLIEEYKKILEEN